MNDDRPPQIDQLLERVRSRWRRRTALHAAIRALVILAGVAAAGMVAAAWTLTLPKTLAVIALLCLVLVAAVIVWALLPLRRTPDDTHLARYIEEANPRLEDRLASAIGLLAAGGRAFTEQKESPLAVPLLEDAARAAADVDAASVVSDETLRRATFQAAAAALLLVAILAAGWKTIGQATEVLALAFFPARVSLEVLPGNARIEVGTPLTIEARLVGSRAPVVARLLHGDAGAPEGEWAATEMTVDQSGAFKATMEGVNAAFKYRVVAGTLASTVYDVVVARAPRVTRVDVEYRYPPSFGAAPHTDEDGGDIYGPPGTDVKLRVHLDRTAATGQLTFGDGKSLTLQPAGDGVMTGALTIAHDTSYRIALADREGLKNPGDTEYFIRTLDDRPPEVHVVRPARDRTVTMLEEIEIEARADDDVGIERMELVYSVRGRGEQVAPFPVPPNATTVTGSHMLYLEDLDVRPGDFVSYFVRARDAARGKRSSEGRSDLFFLEVKPFEQEFAMAQSLASSGNRAVDDLVTAQKEVIVATFKLERRGEAARGAMSRDDVREVARTESALRARVDEASSVAREANMRDPRRPASAGRQGSGRAAVEDPMVLAGRAMGEAVAALNGLKVSEAIPHEMEALNQLLIAQANNRRQQISRQAGSGQNRSSQDLSTLFDRELQRQQQTNYETPTNTEKRDSTSAPDRIKELARRQDELNRKQQELANARNQMPAQERERELEKLQREQSKLRQEAEQVAQQVAQQGSQNSRGSQGSQGGQNSQDAQGSAEMRAVAEEMRNAASDLQRQDPQRASERGQRAVARLQDLERRMRGSSPEEQRRALGEAQLEARQLADQQRQVAKELNRLQQGPQGAAASDALRRLAGEQERIADRARRMQDGLEQQAAGLAGQRGEETGRMQQAAGAGAREMQRARTAERMRQSADQMRDAAAQPNATAQAREQAARAVEAQRTVARDLEALADRLTQATSPRDAAAQRLADQRARAQQLRQELDRLAQQIAEAGKAAPSGQDGRSGQASQERGGQQGSGGSGNDLARLQDEYNQKMREARNLLDQLRREDPSFAQGGPGFTFEGQGMTLSAPGTEAFKQDFAKWEQLRQQATAMLGRAETALSKKLQAADARDLLAAGTDDAAPATYQPQVDAYFRELAKRRK